MFDMLDGAKIDGPAAVTEAAELLGRFNAADGIAHTKADELAEQAVSDAETLASDVAVAGSPSAPTDCVPHRYRRTP